MLTPHLQAPHPSGATWQPLLDGGERDRALELVWQIGKAVRDWQEATSAPTLLGGAGIAVFCAYGEAAGVLERVDVAGMLAGCVARAGEAGLPVGLWNGCAGLRWAIAHLAEGDAAAAITARLDAAIARALESAPADMAFDLYSGLAGVLLAYADDDSPAGRGIVQAALDRLAAVDWAHARPTAGCAHGVAGVVAALAGVASARPARADPARRLLRALVRQVRHGAGEVSWCSGAPGVAVALLAAARALDDDELAGDAIAAVRGDDAYDDVPADATLCHGTAGLAHLCNRLYQATGDGGLAERALGWLRRTMAAHTPGAGVAGFRRWRRKPTTQWEADPGVLVGAAGIGLALLAAATPLAPDWDRVLAADV